MSSKKSSKYWVGLDLGGTKMLAVVFDESFEIAAKKKRKSRGEEGRAAGLKRLGDAVQEAVDQAGIEVSQISGIGIGAPGPLDLKKGVLLNAPNLGWTRAPVRKVLESRFGRPVVVINDVDAGVYGEYRFGAAAEARTAVGIFPGTGIGGGGVFRGELIRGERQSCMEVGHLAVQPGGLKCGCGQNGCLETVASRLSIAASALIAAYRGQAPFLLEHSGGELSRIRSGLLAQSIEAGDKAVENIVRSAAAWIGIGVSTMVQFFAPDVVVLGGGLVEAMPDLYLSEVEKSARKNVMRVYRNSFDLKAAELGDDAAVLGAAAWAQAVTEGVDVGMPA
jgi:glucokinase